jgi:hypothetical protein
MQTVVVYRYRYWDHESKSHKVSEIYATAEMIRNGLGQPENDTAIKVSRCDLTDGGYYVPGTVEPQAR